MFVIKYKFNAKSTSFSIFKRSIFLIKMIANAPLIYDVDYKVVTYTKILIFLVLLKHTNASNCSHLRISILFLNNLFSGKQSYFYIREISPSALSKMFCTYINYFENRNSYMLMYQANKSNQRFCFQFLCIIVLINSFWWTFSI